MNSNEKIIGLEIFQPFAHYRNPYTVDHPQTFPLPPRSTIIGMLQNLIGDYYGVLNRDAWKYLAIYTLGTFTAKFRTFTRYYKGKNFGLKKYGQKFYRTSNNTMINGPSVLSANPTTPLIEELFNLKLVLFMKGKQELLDEIVNCAGKKVISLGRAEDLAFIRNIYSSDELELSDSKENAALIDDYGF